jgi:phosphate transport system substrate-binding protein
MIGKFRAGLMALMVLAHPLQAQDITLTSRDGSLSVDGTLLGYDGEFYRMDSAYGTLTIDGESVICEGPACPDLTAPFAEIRLIGAPEPGLRLMLPLWREFARINGYVLGNETGPEGGFALNLSDPVKAKPVGRIVFAPAKAPEARAALAGGAAELAVAFRADADTAERVAGLDALVPIIARDNPLPRISTSDLAKALTGQVTNWADLGGPDMPIVIHGIDPATSLGEALEARLGNPVAAEIWHSDPASLAEAVGGDPYALAITGLSGAERARVLPLTDSCGFPLNPSGLTLKAEDYPLSLPVFLQSPRRRLPLLAREFLDFLSSPAAQAVVRRAGYTDRLPERQPLTQDGLRLMNAILGAGEETTLPELKRLAAVMAGAERLSLTFRFEDKSATLDAQSQDNLAVLARLLGLGEFRDYDLILAGFSDGEGAADANLELSQQRAEVVSAALKVAAPDLPPGQRLPRIEAFGEALPMACDTTSGGRRLNRRVEVWLRLDPETGREDPAPIDSPLP